MTRTFTKILLAAAIVQMAGSICAEPLRDARHQAGAKFQEPYVDDGMTSAALAKLEGITQKEAIARLELMNEASQLAVRLEKGYPGVFPAIRAKTGPKFSIEVGYYGIPREAALDQIVAVTSSPALRKAVTVVQLSESAHSAKRNAKKALEVALASGINDATVSYDQFSGEIKLLTADPNAAQTKLRPELSRATFNYSIERFGGIKPMFGNAHSAPTQNKAGSLSKADDVPETVHAVGGGFLDSASTGRICTGGFVVISGARTYVEVGLTTAAHCQNDMSYRAYDLNLGIWASPVTLALKEEWTGGGIDVQWHMSFPLGAMSFYSYFFNGASLVDVNGAQLDYPGQYVCKYGRTTGFTCGYIDEDRYVSGIYGEMARFNSNNAYPDQAGEGDSGGPVFVGHMGVGLVHGKDAGGNAYFTSIREWPTIGQMRGRTFELGCYC